MLKRFRQFSKFLKRGSSTRAKDDGNTEETEELYAAPLSPLEKMARLQNLVPFVLDNSLRETTVAQIRGHSIADKARIMEVMVGTGVENFIVASFGDLKRVDDVFLEKMQEEEKIDDRYYAFSEMGERGADGKPSYETPSGLLKIQKYGLKNVILEMNIVCSSIDFETVFSTEEFNKYLTYRMQWIHDNVNKDARVFINFRDGPTAWADITPRTGVRWRMRRTIEFLASMPPHLRPFGLLFEEPTGAFFPWDVAEVSRGMRAAMDRGGWTDGHLLVHIHKGFGLGEACVLEALANGCTGIWCAVTEEGAGVGHCSSLVALTNLARLGNKYVQKTFNFPKLRHAAIEVTKITTSAAPPPKQELYGARSMDMLWDAGMMGADAEEFDLNEFFQVPKSVRVTTFTSKEMFCQRLDEVFGKYIKEVEGQPAKWEPSIGEKMRKQLHADLNSGDKFEYQSPSGLLDLYERSGGLEHRSTMAKCVRERNFEYVGEDHPLMVELREMFDFWDEADESKDDNITYMNFYNGFLSKYLPCYACDRFNVMMEILDADNSGGIGWEELSSRALWALNQFEREREHWTLEELLSMVFEKHLLPEAFKRVQELINQKKNKGNNSKQTSSVAKAIDKLKLKMNSKRQAPLGIADIHLEEEKEKEEPPAKSEHLRSADRAADGTAEAGMAQDETKGETVELDGCERQEDAKDSTELAKVAGEVVLEQHHEQDDERFHRIASAFDIDPESAEFMQPTTEEERLSAEKKAAEVLAEKQRRRAENDEKASYFRQLASTFDLEMEQQAHNRKKKSLTAASMELGTNSFDAAGSADAVYEGGNAIGNSSSLYGSFSFLGSGRWSVTTANGVARIAVARGAPLTMEELPECVADTKNFASRVAEQQRELVEEQKEEAKERQQRKLATMSN